MRRILVCVLLSIQTPIALAGGGPANVMVLYNADEPQALEVAEHYEEARQLLPGRLCGLTGIDPTDIEMTTEEYFTQVLTPFEACLNALPDPDAIDYVVTVRGLPYRIELSTYKASFQAMLQLHRSTDFIGNLLAGKGQSSNRPFVLNPHVIPDSYDAGDYTVSNPSAGFYRTSTGITANDTLPRSFRRTNPVASPNNNSFTDQLLIVGRLDGFDYNDAHDLIDRAIAAEETFPIAEWLCMKGKDSARSARDPECEYASRHLTLADHNAVWLDEYDAELTGHEVVYYLSGSASHRDAIDGQTYVPGAIAGNLTSYGAVPNNFFCSDDGFTCPQNESQTSIARFIRAGATGAHGTVAEPYNAYFPQAGSMLLYSMGYNMGESWFFNQWYLYWQNLYLGDPLTAPYAERPVVTIPDTAVLGEPLTISATHSEGIAGIEVYQDGVLIAQGEGAEIHLDLEGEVDDLLPVFAIAFANNPVLSVDGWENTVPSPRPDIQGWTGETVQIVFDEPPLDTGLSETGDGPGETSGCGCTSAPPASWLSLFPGALLLLWRRNRARFRRQTGA